MGELQNLLKKKGMSDAEAKAIAARELKEADAEADGGGVTYDEFVTQVPHRRRAHTHTHRAQISLTAR